MTSGPFTVPALSAACEMTRLRAMSATPPSHIRVPNDATLADAVERLGAGQLVAFPTETVYGLGADATRDDAVAGIFEAKDRPQFNPLIVHLADGADAALHVVVDTRARRLAERFWPGPLTLVLPRRSDCTVSLLCSAGLDSLGIRVPGHPVARSLLSRFGRPLAAPSANRSGQVSPTTADHVAQSLGSRIGLILDGGPCPVGLESTVLDLTTPRPVLLRPGSITAEEIAELIGPLAERSDDQPANSPGLLASHYAPSLSVRLNAVASEAGEALLAFGPAPTSAAGVVLNLSESGDLRQAAARLFAYLRQLDQPEFTRIAVMPIPQQGLGVAINDRLRRAAAPRP